MAADPRPTPIAGVYELQSQYFIDSRGSFLNLFRAQDKSFSYVWNQQVSQVNLSRTEALGSIRGLHLQAHPHTEAKLVRCLKGKVWDVAVDLRPESSSYGQWTSVLLTPELANAFVIPPGCGHGFQTLEDGSELLYLHSGRWVPSSETGVRWDDPHLAITWPLPSSEISDRDRALPTFSQYSS